MAEWLGNLLAVLAVLAYIIGLVATWVKLGGRMDSAEENIERQSKYHAEHYKAIGDIGNSLSVIVSRLSDHVLSDEHNFKRIEDGIATIQSDIKEVLTRLPR